MVFVLVFLLLAAIILGMSSGAVMDDINHCDTQYPKLSNVSSSFVSPSDDHGAHLRMMPFDLSRARAQRETRSTHRACPDLRAQPATAAWCQTISQWTGAGGY